MTDFLKLTANLRRPKLLIRAARLGLCDYRRERDLRRLLGQSPSADRAVAQLVSAEEELEQDRRAGLAAYSVSRHIEVLIALISEAGLLPRRHAT